MKKIVLLVLCAFLLVGCAKESIKEEGEGKENDSVSFDYSAIVAHYEDSFSQRASAYTELGEDGNSLNIRVDWSSSYNSYTRWTMTCTYDDKTGRLNYTNGVKDNISVNEEGVESLNRVYENGEGYFEIDGTTGDLLWTGAVDDDCRECRFEKMPTLEEYRALHPEEFEEPPQIPPEEPENAQ